MIIGIAGGKGQGKDTVCKIMQYLFYLDRLEESPRVKELWTYDDFIHLCETHGKVPTFEAISKPYIDYLSGWHKVMWAEKMKQCVCLILGCTMEQLEDEGFKAKELGEEWKRYLVVEQIYGTTVGIYSTWLGAQEYIVGRESSTSIFEEFRPKDIYVVREQILTPRLILQLLATECGREIIHPNIWINTTIKEYKPLNSSETWGIEGISPKYPNWIMPDCRFPDNEFVTIRQRGGLIIKVVNPRIINIDTHSSETSYQNYQHYDWVINNDTTIEDLITRTKLFLQNFKLIRYDN